MVLPDLCPGGKEWLVLVDAVFQVQPVDLMAARLQMALSLGWHIIVACFGVGMPAITLLAEWRGHKTGDVNYKLLARRWARVMGVLFAVGAVSGTILSFEMGLLWPGLMGVYGEVIGLDRKSVV